MIGFLKIKNPNGGGSNKSKGFTLIELLVVISIIGFLSSVVLASMQTARDRAKGVAFRASVNEFILAIELKKTNGEALPEERIVKYNPGNLWSWVGTVFELRFDTYFKNYISDFPNPPFTGQFYYYYSEFDKCADSQYMLRVSGAENLVFFSDWIVWPTSSEYKCYPL